MPEPFSSPRAGLTEPRVIIARMAEDLNDLRRENAGVTFDDLYAIGWTYSQVANHFQDAAKEAFLIYSETRATPHEKAQAAPFLKFDSDMRQRLSRGAFSRPSSDANEAA